MRCPVLSELPTPPPGKIGWPWTEGTSQLPINMPDGLPWPKVSIVTPCLNQARFLEETIRSVLLQGYPDLEYFVIDGNSTDGSVQIIQKYAPWLTGWVSEKDHGQSEAINKGLERANGAILAWLNSDDVYMVGSIASVVNELSKHPEAGMIFGNLEIINESSNVTGRFSVGLYTFQNLLTQKMVIPQPTAFWRRKVFQTIGPLRTDLHYAMDFEYWIRIGRHNSIIQFNPTLAQFRISNVSKTGSQSAGWGPEFMRILDEMYAVPNPSVELQELKSKAYAGAYLNGGCGFLSTNISTARIWLWRAVQLNPCYLFSVKWWQAALKASMGQWLYNKGRLLKKILMRRTAQECLF